jgi:hypothetical protein
VNGLLRYWFKPKANWLGVVKTVTKGTEKVRFTTAAFPPGYSTACCAYISVRLLVVEVRAAGRRRRSSARQEIMLCYKCLKVE